MSEWRKLLGFRKSAIVLGTRAGNLNNLETSDIFPMCRAELYKFKDTAREMKFLLLLLSVVCLPGGTEWKKNSSTHSRRFKSFQRRRGIILLKALIVHSVQPKAFVFEHFSPWNPCRCSILPASFEFCSYRRVNSMNVHIHPPHTHHTCTHSRCLIEGTAQLGVPQGLAQ